METIENLNNQSREASELKIWIAPEIKELDTIYTYSGGPHVKNDGSNAFSSIS